MLHDYWWKWDFSPKELKIHLSKTRPPFKCMVIIHLLLFPIYMNKKKVGFIIGNLKFAKWRMSSGAAYALKW
jgi:hypothetical protein